MRRLLTISLLAVVAAGCGGGGDRLSQEEFTTRANAICQEFERKVDDLDQPEGLGDLEEFTDRSAEIVGDGRDELGDLNPPEDIEDGYERLLETLGAAIEDIGRIGEAAADGDEAEVRRIGEEINAKGEETNRLALELGLDDCAAD